MVNADPRGGTGESVACSKRWYVALVRMHHEKKVADRLSEMGIESFVPIQQEVRQWSDRRKVVDRVLLPMMVFVHVDPRRRMEVFTIPAVSRYMVLRGESSPAVIPDEQMNRFRFMLDYSDEAVCMNDSLAAGRESLRRQRSFERARRRARHRRRQEQSRRPSRPAWKRLCRYARRLCRALQMKIEV